MRRSEQPVDNFRERIGRSVFIERGDFFGSRRQTRKIQRRAAEQVVLVRRANRFQSLFFETRQNKFIDRVARPLSHLS